MTAVDGTVDAHVHLWDLDRFGLSWFRPDLGLPAAARPDDLAAAVALAEPPGGPIRGVIAVQAADTPAEAEWLLGLRHPLLAGAVLQYDPADAAGRAPALVGRGARGVRVAVPGRRADLTDVPGLDALCERVAGAAGVVEFLVRAEQLPAVAELARRHPGTTVVVCHLGLGSGDPGERWESALRTAAARPNVAAKVSGVVTEGRGAGSRLRRALTVAVDQFGAGRLLFGSDWPMSARIAPYDRIVAATAAALPALGAAGETAFWGGTARELYAL